MDPATAAFLASLGFKGLSSIFGGRSKKKQNTENRNATVAGLNIRQKQGEDSRRARLKLGSSLLGGVPATTAGGGVNTNVALDPALVEQLGQERTYDFGSAVPKEVGGFDSFLSGLFGGAADLVPSVVGGGGGEGAMRGVPVAPGWHAPAPTVDIDDLLRAGRDSRTPGSRGGGVPFDEDLNY